MKRVQVSSIALTGKTSPENSFARELRRADSFTKLAVAAGEQVLAGLPPSKDYGGNTGLFIGTACGPLATNFAALDTLLDDGEGQMSPTLFSHSVFNTAAGYLSRLFSIEGPTYTLTSYCWPFLLALREGKAAVANGMVKRALVLGVETYSRVLADAGVTLKGDISLYPGAAAWVLEEETGTASPPLCILGSVATEENRVPAEDLLSPHPLEHAFALSRFALSLQDSDIKTKEWSQVESFGTARVGLQAPRFPGNG